MILARHVSAGARRRALTMPQAHGGSRYDNTAVDGYWYWFGVSLDYPTLQLADGRDVEENDGVRLYRSIDPLAAFNAWEFVGIILSPVSPVKANLRPHVIYNASTSKFVLWAIGYDPSNNSSRPANIATASSITGPWTWQTTSLIPGSASGFYDCNLFQEGADSCVVFQFGGGIRIAKLTSDYLNTTNVGGESVDLLTTQEFPESPVLFKVGSVYFLITSGRPNYYHSQVTFLAQYQTASNIFGPWTDPVPLYAYDPAGGPYNGQSTDVFRVGTDYYLLTDFWNNVDLRQSYYIQLPLVFATSTSVRPTLPPMSDIASLAPISWRAAEVVAVNGTGSLQMQPQATNGQSIYRWQDRLAVVAEQPTSGARPTFVENAINGYPALSFDGVDDYLQFPAVPAKHIFIVCKPDDTGTTLGGVLGAAAGDFGIRRFFPYFTPTTDKDHWIGPADGSAGDFATGGSMKINGVVTDVHPSGTWAILEVSNSTAGSMEMIGVQNLPGARHFKGLLPEILMFGVVKTDPEAAIIRAQLGAKFGISTI